MSEILIANDQSDAPSREEAVGLYVELKKSEARAEIGECVETLSRKGDFISKERPYVHAPWLSSGQLRANILRELEDQDVTDILGPAIVDVLHTNPDLAALDVGVLAMSSWKGDNPLDDQGYKLILDYIINEVQQSIKTGLAQSETEELFVKFNVTSSIGVIGDGEFSKFNCSHSFEHKKRLIESLNMEPAEARVKFPKSGLKIQGFRLQTEKAKKANQRPAWLFDERWSNKVYLTTVANEWHGARVRAVIGFSWIINRYLMVINRLIFAGLTPTLHEFWEFTHDDILDGTLNRFVFCTDVSNNDLNFIHSENEYIHSQLLDEDMFEWWSDAYKEPLYGVYVDSNDIKRYYKTTEKFKAPLYSGEGLTSIVNKIKHTTMQVFNHMKAHGDPFTEEGVDNRIKTLVSTQSLKNNGDDTLDKFDSAELRDRFGEIAVNNPYGVIGEEEPGFSGISLSVDNDTRVTGAFANAMSLFKKLIERERRDYDSTLGSLPYNSIKGQFQFLEKYQGYDDELIAEFKDIYLRMVGLDSDILLDLEDLAEAELEGADVRQQMINRLMTAMKLTNPSKLFYEFSFEELYAADPEATEELFLHAPVKQLLWDGLTAKIKKW